MSIDLNPLESACEIIKDKFYFLTFQNRGIKNIPQIHYFCTDEQFIYRNFHEDFGPLSLSSLTKYCRLVSRKIEAFRTNGKILCHVTSQDSKKRTNAAFLVGCFCVLVAGKTPEETVKCLISQPNQPVFIPFRDVSTGPSLYNLGLLDCFRAMVKANMIGMYNVNTFNVDETENLEKLANGDINWIVPGKFLAFPGPQSTNVDNKTGYPTRTPDFYLDFFVRSFISTVVKLNKEIYHEKVFTDAGLDHFELYFPDGTVPSLELVERFFEVSNNAVGGIAVHCKAGLGRTGTMIGCYMMKYNTFTAAEVIAWIRVARPGSIIGMQQIFLNDMEKFLVRPEELEVIKRQQLPFQLRIQKQFNSLDTQQPQQISAFDLPPSNDQQQEMAREAMQSKQSNQLSKVPTYNPHFHSINSPQIQQNPAYIYADSSPQQLQKQQLEQQLEMQQYQSQSKTSPTNFFSPPISKSAASGSDQPPGNSKIYKMKPQQQQQRTSKQQLQQQQSARFVPQQMSQTQQQQLYLQQKQMELSDGSDTEQSISQGDMLNQIKLKREADEDQQHKVRQLQQQFQQQAHQQQQQAKQQQIQQQQPQVQQQQHFQEQLNQLKNSQHAFSQKAILQAEQQQPQQQPQQGTSLQRQSRTSPLPIQQFIQQQRKSSTNKSQQNLKQQKAQQQIVDSGLSRKNVREPQQNRINNNNVAILPQQNTFNSFPQQDKNGFQEEDNVGFYNYFTNSFNNDLKLPQPLQPLNQKPGLSKLHRYQLQQQPQKQQPQTQYLQQTPKQQPQLSKFQHQQQPQQQFLPQEQHQKLQHKHKPPRRSTYIKYKNKDNQTVDVLKIHHTDSGSELVAENNNNQTTTTTNSTKNGNFNNTYTYLQNPEHNQKTDLFDTGSSDYNHDMLFKQFSSFCNDKYRKCFPPMEIPVPKKNLVIFSPQKVTSNPFLNKDTNLFTVPSVSGQSTSSFAPSFSCLDVREGNLFN